MPVEMKQMRSSSSVLKCKPSMFEALDRQKTDRHRCDRL